jgi:uncharacterized phage protein gp47/JayE
MADQPTPRSYQQILGEMIATITANTGIQGLRDGNPLLTVLEAAAQSDQRTAQDVWALLDSLDLDRATGQRLRQIGTEEGVIPIGARPAVGAVTIRDSRFEKVATSIYAGIAALNAGATSIPVNDATRFPASGSIYIGRGTGNAEGPLDYTSVVRSGGSWELVLKGGQITTRYHGALEEVVLGQGGDRPIPAGTVVQTTDLEPVTYRTRRDVLLLDGEAEAGDVEVIADAPGTDGNMPAGAIRAFASEPFPGAEVINPLPFVRGENDEPEAAYKDRIRKVRRLRRSQYSGTDHALQQAVLGIADDTTKVTSSSVVRRGGATTVYIDDGTGYEQQDAGVTHEVLCGMALGGERYFQLDSPRPISKAFLASSARAPFALRGGMVLAVRVGGVTSTHTFQDSDFRTAGAATAREAVASINGATGLHFFARTADSGNRVVLMAATETDGIEVVAPAAGTDANAVLGFPRGEHVSLRLYKNDRLLYRDGLPARLYTARQSEWARSIVAGDTLTLDVDGTGPVTYSFSDTDFPGYRMAAEAPLATWAEALAGRIPGITALVSGDRISLESNRGNAEKAFLEVTGGTLVAKGMFAVSKAQGRPSDYEFNRQLGQIALAAPLAPGDRLTAGALDPEPYLESPFIGDLVTFPLPARFVFVADGDATLVPIQVTNETNITVSQQGATGVRYFGVPGTFAGVQAGDWLVNIDPALVTTGAWQISAVAEDHSWVQIERQTGFIGQGRPADGGLLVARTTGIPQVLTIEAGGYSMADLASRFSELAGLAGRTPNGRLQVYSVRPDGGVACLAASPSGAILGLAGKAFSGTPDVAVLAGGSAGIPTMRGGSVTAATGYDLTLAGDRPMPGDRLRWHHPDSSGRSSNAGRSGPVAAIDTTVAIREDGLAEPCVNDRYVIESPLALRAEEKLEFAVDGGDGLTVALGHRIAPSGPLALSGRDLTVDPVGLGDFDLSDFALHGHPRAITHAGQDRAILWRYTRTGPDGEGLPLSYAYSNTANAKPVALARTDSNPGIEIRLPTGAARTGIGWQARTCLDVSSIPIANGYRHSLILYEAVIGVGKAERYLQAGARVRLTFDHQHPFRTGDILYVDSADAKFPPGNKRVIDANPDGTGKSLTYFELGTITTNSSPLKVTTVQHQPNLLTIQAGDILDLAATGLGEIFPRPVRVAAVTAKALTVEGKAPLAKTGRFFIEDGTKVGCYQPKPITAAELCDQLGTDGIVTGTPLADGIETITLSTDDEYVGGDANSLPVVLEGGVNWVASADLGSIPNRLTLKADWKGGTEDLENEPLYLVPNHPETLARWLASPSASALPTRATASLAVDGKVILKALTTGAKGRLAIRGTPTGTSIPVVDQATVIDAATTPKLRFRVRRDASSGLTCGPARVRGRIAQARSWMLPPTARTVIAREADGRWTFSVEGAKFYDVIWRSDQTKQPKWRIQRHGELASLRNVDGKEVPVKRPQTAVVLRYANQAANMGVYQVHNLLPTQEPALWIDNPNALDEDLTITMMGQMEVVAPGAVLPGDYVDVTSDVFGADNRGRWRVVEWISEGKIVVDGPRAAITLPDGTGIYAPSVRILEGKPATAWVWIRNIIPVGEYLELICDVPDPAMLDYPIGVARQSVLELPAKLSMDATEASGRDAYHYATGLIGECARVIYGDERDPTAYPGLQAAGATVDIQGPIIRRIRISLALRCRGDHQAGAARVRSAVAAVINSLGVGESISIARLVAAASDQPGVEGVSVLSPAYGPGRELIAVQPHEKPQVLDLDADISIKILGA